MTRSTWTEKKIHKMQSEGFGDGRLAEYKPWIQVKDVSSLGRSRRIWSPKTNRTHHLLSDVEYKLFIALEWQRDFVDIREQFPLDRTLTQDIARSLGIPHPCYPGTHVPTVMTADFLVTQVKDDNTTLLAFNAKTSDEAEDERSLCKLEIQREYFSQVGIAHHIVFDCEIPPSNVANIGDIREAPLRPDETEPRAGYFGDLCQRMVYDMPNWPQHITLERYCSEFDGRFGCLPGTGIRVARILMAERILLPDLSAPNLNHEPLHKLLLVRNLAPRRVAGAV